MFVIKIITRGAVLRLGVLGIFLLIFCVWSFFVMIKMPGESYTGAFLPLTEAEEQLRAELLDGVDKLAGRIGERNIWNEGNLTAARDFIQSSLAGIGYEVLWQEYEAKGVSCRNIEVEIAGTKELKQIIIVGAHYDTVYSSPGANDNASGVAGNLALARRFFGSKTDSTLRFVFFVNEEPPFFRTGEMGSIVYASRCRERGEQIVAMLSLETIGCYSEQPNSQKYPFPLGLVYPSTGNFVGFVSNISSRKLLHRVIGLFRENCEFPSEGGAIPEMIPGINWSDHSSFWEYGFPAVMVTDTAIFRYPYYHSAQDTADQIDYDRMARVVGGVEKVIGKMAGLVE